MLGITARPGARQNANQGEAPFLTTSGPIRPNIGDHRIEIRAPTVVHQVHDTRCRTLKLLYLNARPVDTKNEAHGSSVTFVRLNLIVCALQTWRGSGAQPAQESLRPDLSPSARALQYSRVGGIDPRQTHRVGGGARKAVLLSVDRRRQIGGARGHPRVLRATRAVVDAPT